MRHQLLVLLLFPMLSFAQTIAKDRFIAHDGKLVWSEKIEIKDMDTPIIIETITLQLKDNRSIYLDSILQNGILTGMLNNSPSTPNMKAHFRIDILYESYVITVSDIVLEQKKLEDLLLQKNGDFVRNFPKHIETFDRMMMSFFVIKF